MNYLRSPYNGNAQELFIMQFNDLHFGAPAVDYRVLNDCFRFIEQNESNTRILINGDIIEGVIKESKGDIYEQTMSPREQVDHAVKLFEPYAHLIDGVTQGNHDARVENAVSFDPVEIFCKDLGIKDKYLGVEGVVSWHWNFCFRSVQMHHGMGGGATLAAVENNMKKLWKSNSDVMYCGHWHKEFVKFIKKYEVSKENKHLKVQKKLLVCGNTILDTQKYAKKAGYEESFPSQSYLTFSGKPKDQYIKVDWIR